MGGGNNMRLVSLFQLWKKDRTSVRPSKKFFQNLLAVCRKNELSICHTIKSGQAASIGRTSIPRISIIMVINTSAHFHLVGS
jgi:hypothetical protein